MMLGEVDNVDGHFIATKFHGLVFPSGSMYVVSQDYSRHGNVSRMTWSGVPVRFNWKSAALAYPRVWLWFLGLAWPFLLHWGENVSGTPASTWMTSGGLAALALVFTFGLGRLSSREKERLRLLGRVTGLRLDPRKLTEWTRSDKRDFLEAELGKRGVVTTPEGILAASQGAPLNELEVLYTFACYAGDGRDWRDVAARILEQHAAASR